MPTTETEDAVRLCYATRGTGPPDLLFMHGWAGSGDYFAETIDHLDLDRVRAITFDFRGHGDSIWSGDSCNLGRITGDALAVADAAGAERPVLVGFSMSGKFAQYVAVKHPDRVCGLVLVAGASPGEITVPPHVLDDWYARAGSPERMVDLIRNFITRPVAADVLARFGERAALVPRPVLEATMATLTDTSFAHELATLDLPTLVVAGADDAFFSPDILRNEIVRPVARARLAILECNHEIPMEQPRELAAMLEAFLAGLRQPIASLPGAGVPPTR
jgi:pimeloyl-ACP methyl ester carboxylesterase